MAVAVKSGGLWDMVRCWRGVVQQQVGCGAVGAGGACVSPAAGSPLGHARRCSGSWRCQGRHRTWWRGTARCTGACAVPRRSSLGSRPPSWQPWARALPGLCCSSPS